MKDEEWVVLERKERSHIKAYFTYDQTFLKKNSKNNLLNI